MGWYQRRVHGILKNQMKVVGLAAFLLSATFTSAVRINAYESSTSINEHVLIQGISDPITFAEITKPKKKEIKGKKPKDKQMKEESKGTKPKDKIKKEDEKKDKEDEEDNKKGNVKPQNTAINEYVLNDDLDQPITFAEILSSTDDKTSDMTKYAKLFKIMGGDQELVPIVDEKGAT